MRPDEVRDEIAEQILVTRQSVTFAKSFLLAQDGIGPHIIKDLLPMFVKSQGYEKPGLIVVHPDVNSERDIRQAAGFLTSALAFIEAVHSLIQQGYFLPVMPYESWRTHVSWTDAPSGGRNNGDWRFPEDFFGKTSSSEIGFPMRVLLAPSYHHDRPQPLTDGDLFIADAGVESAHTDVKQALRDATDCFRHDLYRPTAALLGKAVEGAWTELGCSLAVAHYPSGSNRDKFKER